MPATPLLPLALVAPIAMAIGLVFVLWPERIQELAVRLEPEGPFRSYAASPGYIVFCQACGIGIWFLGLVGSLAALLR
jgi:hypothetical protein